jgi:hypothetical protein
MPGTVPLAQALPDLFQILLYLLPVGFVIQQLKQFVANVLRSGVILD